MLEGFKAQNPAQFPNIVNDLKDYLGVQGTQSNQPSPLDAFKQSNPAEFKQIEDFYKQVTGKDLSGAVDPNQARLTALEQRYAQEQEARQTAVINQQIDSARTKANEFVAGALKNTFADGMGDRYTSPNGGLLWQKAVADADCSRPPDARAVERQDRDS